MDTLDKYKKAWDNQSIEINKISREDIYKMSHSKSSSIVKWIFIIGLLELILPYTLMLIFDVNETSAIYQELGLVNYFYYFNIILVPILLFFLFLFYKNYRSISTTDSTKKLMDNILKTRKTVRNYIFLNLAFALIHLLVVSIISIKTYLPTSSTKELIAAYSIATVISGIIITIIWLIYQLLYGILLRKLTLNYKELAKLDV